MVRVGLRLTSMTQDLHWQEVDSCLNFIRTKDSSSTTATEAPQSFAMRAVHGICLDYIGQRKGASPV
jgi:hypothetical protein